MDASILQPMGLIAVAVAMALTLYDMRSSLRPATCPKCAHCVAIAEEEARLQEQLTREYARRVGLEDDEDDHRRIG
jgi:protein-S-isoprenylcysteine O-methyltransferase Ste14